MTKVTESYLEKWGVPKSKWTWEALLWRIVSSKERTSIIPKADIICEAFKRSRRIFPKHGAETWTKKGTTQRASQMQMTCSKRRRRLDDPSAIGSACWTIFLPGFWNTFSVIWILLPWCKGANRGILLHSWQDSLWSRIDFGTLDARYTAQITDPQRATLLRNCRALEHCQVLKLSGCTPWRERGSNHWEDRDLVLDKSVGVGQIEMDLESQSCHAWRQMSFRGVLRTLHGGFPWLQCAVSSMPKTFSRHSTTSWRIGFLCISDNLVVL